MRTGSVSLLRWKASLDQVALPFQRFLDDSSEATSRLASSIQASRTLRMFRQWFDPGHLSVHFLGDHHSKRRITMFGKNEVDQDEDTDENELPPAPQLKLSEVLQAAESLRADKPEITP